MKKVIAMAAAAAVMASSVMAATVYTNHFDSNGMLVGWTVTVDGIVTEENVIDSKFMCEAHNAGYFMTGEDPVTGDDKLTWEDRARLSAACEASGFTG